MNIEIAQLPCTADDDDRHVCSYCFLTKPSDEDFMFKCVACNKYVHPSCLQSGKPSPLEGDNFFLFTCCTCADVEQMKRMYLTWKQVVILTLYNLHVIGGHGRKGFFRFKEDVCQFINDNWALLFGVKPMGGRGQWCGTVAGVLSSSHPETFLNGQSVLNTSGWWSLAKIKPPDLRPENFGNKTPRSKSVKNTAKEKKLNDMLFLGDFKSTGLRSSKRKRQASVRGANFGRYSASVASKESRIETEIAAVPAPEEKSFYDDVTSTWMRDTNANPPSLVDGTEPSSGSPLLAHNVHSYTITQPKPVKTEPRGDHCQPSIVNEAFLQNSSNVGNCKDDNTFNEIDHPIPSCISESITSFGAAYAGTHQGPDADLMSTSYSWSTDKNISEAWSSTRHSIIIDRPTEPPSVDSMKQGEGEVADTKSPDTKSPDDETMKSGTQRPDNNGPALADSNLVPLTPFEEQKLLTTLNNNYSIIKNTTDLMRLRRKLALRQLKRERGLELLDIDSKIRSTLARQPNRISEPATGWTDPARSSDFHIRILDRYSCHRHGQFTKKFRRYDQVDFFTRITGSDSDQYSKTITSCYTSRILKPYIWQDFECTPLKLRLMLELKSLLKTRGIFCDMKSLKYPIDYCYVQPHHIPTINSICNEFFWHGIDLSESLQYPDFSVVALYRKLIIGFAFMVPDVEYHEAYIPFLFVHPEWRRDNIASFMLYHLIQTCYGKDVTLHVSASNPAMILYQKFGFKCEKLLLNFYDKYFSSNNKECRHAFLLRLKR